MIFERNVDRTCGCGHASEANAVARHIHKRQALALREALPEFYLGHRHARENPPRASFTKSRDLSGLAVSLGYLGSSVA